MAAPSVTAIGMVTNLGANATGAAAALRAGISRRTTLEDYTTFDPGADLEAPVTGAPITGLTDGF